MDSGDEQRTFEQDGDRESTGTEEEAAAEQSAPEAQPATEQATAAAAEQRAARARVAGPRLNISVKLVGVSLLLLVVVVGLFGVVNSLQSRRIINDATSRLEQSVAGGLRHTGKAQLQLLAETTRIALVQSDFTTLQSVIHNIKKRDELLTEAAVMDAEGVLVAHSSPRQVGRKAAGILKEIRNIKDSEVRSPVLVGGHTSMVFAAPVEQAGARLCTVFLAYSLKPLEAALARAERTKQAEIGANIRNTLAVGLLAVALGVMLSVVQSVRIARPIRALARQADQIAGGDLEARAEVGTRDEIGLLGERINYMAEQVLVLMRETKHKVALEKEFEVASAIQTTLVPEGHEVELSGLTVAAHFKPAAECGGDWWTCCELEDGRVVVLVGDVTGHGIGAAMITAVVKGAVGNMLSIVGGRLDLALLLTELDKTVYEASQGKYAMTCFASIYDPRRRTLACANAGHTFPLLCRRAAEKLEQLAIRGHRLGDVAGEPFAVQQVQLEPEDVVVWYTDGIVEGENDRGEEFGERRLRALIRDHAHLSPGAARDELVNRATRFFGEARQEDDITVVFGKVS